MRTRGLLCQGILDVGKQNITTILISNPKFAGYNNSVFNASGNIKHVAQIESLYIAQIKQRGSTDIGTALHYQELAMGAYEQSSVSVADGCTSMSAKATVYVNAVMQDYNKLMNNT